jgi:hypothetical protein
MSDLGLSCRYQEYKSEYISTQKRAFFDAHKDEEWYFLSSTFLISLFLLTSFNFFLG